MAILKGTAHIWGVDTHTGMTVSSYTITTKPAIDEVVLDEQGRQIHLRMDDIVSEISLEGFLPTLSGVPSIGDSFTYKTVPYIIKDVELRGEAKGFTKLSIKGTKYEQF